MTKNIPMKNFVEQLKNELFEQFPNATFCKYEFDNSNMHILEVRPIELFQDKEFCKFALKKESEFIEKKLGLELCFWDEETVRISGASSKAEKNTVEAFSYINPRAEKNTMDAFSYINSIRKRNYSAEMNSIPAPTKKQIPLAQKINAWVENLLEEIKYEYLKPTLVGMASLAIIILVISIVFFQQKQGLENEKNMLAMSLKAKNEEIATLKNGKQPIGESLVENNTNSEEQIQSLQKKLMETTSLKEWYRKQINAFPSKVLPLIKNAIPMIKGETADLRTGEYQIVKNNAWKKINIYLIDKRKKEFACFLTKNNDDLMLEIGKITDNNSIIIDGIGEFALNGNDFELK